MVDTQTREETRPVEMKAPATRSTFRANFFNDKKALKKLKLVAVAYSDVKREWFPTEEAFIAEAEVVERANQVVAEVEMLGIPVKGYPSDPAIRNMSSIRFKFKLVKHKSEYRTPI
jgi:hypothetical protein